MWKENIGSLQSSQCSEVWNRINDKAIKVRPTKKLEVQKRPRKKPRKKTDQIP